MMKSRLQDQLEKYSDVCVDETVAELKICFYGRKQDSPGDKELVACIQFSPRVSISSLGTRLGRASTHFYIIFYYGFSFVSGRYAGLL